MWDSVNKFGVMSLDNYYHGAGSLSQASLRALVSKGYACVVNVRGGTHWVLVTSYAGGSTFYVNDPGFADNAYTYADMGNFVVYKP